MSAIAGILCIDGAPVATGAIEAMAAAMRARGPDGLTHWRQGPVALAQCMLRTTPESLEEALPLANEDQSLVLVMDGRVDNFEELRRQVLGKGVILRTRSDAELVLRAYEIWGEACVDRIVGECVFFVWDARRQRLFGARDGAGARHFYYHQGPGWFAFASEIKGLLALPIARRLNETRLLDYLVEAFDRDDEVGTFYQGILRLPAGHAMTASSVGVRTWRWWNPGELTQQTFASLAECTEAFMEQLRVAVKCRLRSIKPVGAMLSGGLDSSTIVGLISKEFRGELREPLRTVSLIREDREACPDWRSIEQILRADPWLQPTVVTSAAVDQMWQRHLDSIARADEPFSVFNGLTYGLTYAAAREAGCGVVLDGMAGDVLFYDLSKTKGLVARSARFSQIGPLGQAYRYHVVPFGPWRDLLAALPGAWVPQALRALLRPPVRRLRDARALKSGDLARLRPDVARAYLAAKRAAADAKGQNRHDNEQQEHAGRFTSGLISFGHETYGPLALAQGVEPRSPFSDRRVIEFAIRMPVEAKWAIPAYKHLLRTGGQGLLPQVVLGRSDIGSHPGWTFFQRLAAAVAHGNPEAWAAAAEADGLSRWVKPGKVDKNQGLAEPEASYDWELVQLRRLILVQFLRNRIRAWRPADGT